MGTSKWGDHDYYNQEFQIKVEDLHDENVFIRGGDLFVIDPVVFLDERGKMARISGSVSSATEELA